jgi:hypothetical protein
MASVKVLARALASELAQGLALVSVWALALALDSVSA